MERPQYQVSVVMAVYNVEHYLREAVDSLLRQNISFENVQLILVNDGSTDGSGAICDEYAAQYPANVLALHKENGGVSSARNLGLAHVKGEYVNFLDADDKLSPGTLRALCSFLTEHKDETDAACFPMRFFDGQTGEHILNGKFKKGSRVLRLHRDWQNPQLSLSSSLVKADVMRSYRFDERLSYAEDAKIMLLLLSEKQTLGVVKEGCYWYRRRSGGAQSAIQSSQQNPGWYLPYLRYFQQEVLDCYREKLGYVPRFVQNTLMYDLQWRLKLPQLPSDILNGEEQAEYMATLSGILGQIEEEVIMAQKQIFREQKLLALMLKYGCGPRRVTLGRDIGFRFQEEVRFTVSQFPLKLEFIQIAPESCTVEGTISVLSCVQEMPAILAELDGSSYPVEYGQIRDTVRGLGRDIQCVTVFRVTLPLNPGEDHSIRFLCPMEGMEIPLKALSFGPFFPISGAYGNMFWEKNGWLLRHRGGTLCLEASNPAKGKKYRSAFQKELWNKNKPGGRKAALIHWLLPVLKKAKHRPLWLLSDRVMKAGDNGEALFRYLRENHRQIDVRFVISGQCADYAKMKKLGPVLKRESYRYKLALLLSDRIVSSAGEVENYNPFHGYSEPYRSMLADTKFVFLQHGVTKDDMSKWLGRPNKNLAGLVAAAKPEAEAFLSGAYEYSGQQIWLTGFPRFDRLYRDEQKWITVMPTWRRYLMGSFHAQTDTWSLAPGAESSDYVRFYNELLNHPRLLAAAKQHGYRLMFLPHPNFQTHLDIFQKAEDVTFLGREMDYRDIFAKSDLILTDYSSVVFDFAYLRKPVLYTHFDAETFFAGEHVYSKGYFDYERDGFGEVLYTLEDTVDALIAYMETECRLKPLYRQRIDGFFAFDDGNNCQRVYEKLLAMDKENTHG